MKTAIAALIALGLIAGQANARTPFEVLADTAPRSSVFADLQRTAPRSIFDDIRDTAPKSTFDQIRDSAPRADGVFGSLETSAP